MQPLCNKKAFKSSNSAVFNNSATPTYKVNINKNTNQKSSSYILNKKYFTPSRLHIAVAFKQFSIAHNFKSKGRFFFKKMSISALSPPSLFLLASIMLDATLNSLSLSTLVQGAQRNFAAVAARVGKRIWLTPQYWNGLSERGTVCSVKYVCI